jgi:hypothetical protein
MYAVPIALISVWAACAATARFRHLLGCWCRISSLSSVPLILLLIPPSHSSETQKWPTTLHLVAPSKTSRDLSIGVPNPLLMLDFPAT